MAKKSSVAKVEQASSLSPEKEKKETGRMPVPRPSSLLDTRVVYCGDNLKQLGPCRTGQFWGEKEKRAFEDRHENTRAYIDYMRPRCVPLARRMTGDAS